MIDYVNILDQDRDLIGLVDTAKSIIWRTDYYSSGYFEIYASATDENGYPSIATQILKAGYYVTRPNDENVGLIESVETETNLQDGRMLIASGRFVKVLLENRIIYSKFTDSNGVTRVNSTILSGNLETAVRSLITSNAINSSETARNIPILSLRASIGLTDVIVDENGVAAEKQVTYDNLLTYTNSLLQEYKIGSSVTFNSSTKKFEYGLLKGADRSVDNTEGNAPIIFSTEFDNLTSTNYRYDISSYKTTALVSGEGDGLEKHNVLVNETNSGLNRKEVYIDGGGISQKYKDSNDIERTYTNSEYAKMLKTEGKQQLSKLTIIETFNGDLDITNSNVKYNQDFFIGDLITIEDKEINKYINARILNFEEVQDDNGYKAVITYGV